MFKKQHNQKTAAPIRSSERRKLRSKVVEDYQLQEIASEDIDLLVPDGLLSAKFVTHLNEPGVIQY
jgi:translation initiation factor 2D